MVWPGMVPLLVRLKHAVFEERWPRTAPAPAGGATPSRGAAAPDVVLPGGAGGARRARRGCRNRRGQVSLGARRRPTVGGRAGAESALGPGAGRRGADGRAHSTWIPYPFTNHTPSDYHRSSPTPLVAQVTPLAAAFSVTREAGVSPARPAVAPFSPEPCRDSGLENAHPRRWRRSRGSKCRRLRPLHPDGRQGAGQDARAVA